MSIADKITSIQEHIGDTYDTLELGGADLTNVNKNIENISGQMKDRYLDYMNNGTEQIWNNWEKVTGTGTNISLNNTIYAPMKIDAQGNSIQEGTPTPTSPQPINSVGDNVNLLEITTFNNNEKTITKNDITAVINEDGSITVTGTASSQTDIYFTKNDFTLLGEFYYLCNSPSANARVEFTCSVDGTTKYLNDYGTGNKQNATTSFSFNSLTLKIANGTSVNTTFYPKVALGNVVEGYSPYNMGSIAIEKCNKNFLDSIVTSGTSNAVDYSFNNGKIILNGSCSSDRVIIPLKPQKFNGTFTFSRNNNTTTALKNAGGTNIFSVQGTNLSVIATVNDTVSQIVIYDLTNKSFSNFELELQIESGNSASNFVPHQSTTYPIYTQAPFRSIGDVRDDFVKQAGVWYERHKIGRVVLDGTEEGWNKASTSVAPNTTRFYMNFTDLYNSLSSTDNTVYVKSNELIGLSWVQIYTTDTSTLYAISNYNDQNTTTGRFIVRVESSVASTVETFKTWLGTHNITAYYVKKEPTLTPCTNEQVAVLEQIHTEQSYNGQTNIYSNDVVAPYLECVALKN